MYMDISLKYFSLFKDEDVNYLKKLNWFRITNDILAELNTNFAGFNDCETCFPKISNTEIHNILDKRAEYIDWQHLVQGFPNIDFINKYLDKINFDNLSENPSLYNFFIENFPDKLNWEKISKYHYRVTNDKKFIADNFEKLHLNLILARLKRPFIPADYRNFVKSQLHRKNQKQNRKARRKQK